MDSVLGGDEPVVVFRVVEVYRVDEPADLLAILLVLYLDSVYQLLVKPLVVL